MPRTSKRGLAISTCTGSRIVHFDSLIRNAQDSYADYLEKSKEMDKLEALVDQI